MIKLRKGNVLIFGITDKNVEKLKKDQPIKFNLNELGMDDITVFIVHGKDEQKLYEMFKDQIDPLKTIITDTRSPNN
jgi:hypothetical protein